MRIFVLLLAIVLLPLRGWMGDAMAMQSMPPPPASPQHAMAHGGHEAPAATTLPPCHGAAMDAAAKPDHDMSGDDNAHDMSSHTNCTACQVCHSVALAAPELPPGVQQAPHAVPRANAAGYASAEPQPLRKPPIS